jgi:DNA-binding MarR family transcriptional regulator
LARRRHAARGLLELVPEKHKGELTTRPSRKAMAEILEQLTQFAYAQVASKGLRSAQWAALRYFDQTEEPARTVGSFAQYNMTTPSSASQTIKTLVEKKFLNRVKVGGDQRSYRVDLSPSGRELLVEDPLNLIIDAMAMLSAKDQVDFAGYLEKLFQNVSSQAMKSRRPSS